jgi:hypothetical protein
MSILRGDESHLKNSEEREEDYMTIEAWDQLRTELVQDLQYRAYRWQRTHYGLEAERLAKVFPRAEQFEKAYQEELRRAA